MNQLIGSQIDKLPPADPSAEIAVLGSVMIAPHILGEVAEKLRPADFYDDANREIYSCMVDLADAGRPFDATLLVAELKQRDRLNICGGYSYLAKLVNAVPHADHALYYADIVRDKAGLRELIELSIKTLNASQTESDTPGRIGAQLVAEAERILARESDGLRSMAECVLEARSRRENNDRFGVATGIESLDRFTGGLKPSQLTVLAAGTSVGKTAFAAQIAAYVAGRGRNVLFVTLEVDGAELVEAKLISHLLDSSKSFTEKEEEISKLPISVFDSGKLDVSRLRGLAKLQKARGKLDLLIVDYLQLLDCKGCKGQYERVTEISRQLRLISQEIKVPVLALSQLNRDSTKEKRRPQLHDLRESGAIEQDANNVWLLHREDRQRPEAELIIAKHRGGELGEQKLYFDGRSQLFSPRMGQQITF